MYITWAYLHLIRGFQTACVHICLVTSVMVNFRGLGGFCLHYRFFLDLPGPPECFCKELCALKIAVSFPGSLRFIIAPLSASVTVYSVGYRGFPRWNMPLQDLHGAAGLFLYWLWGDSGSATNTHQNKDAMMLPQQTRDIHPVLVWCWATVANSGPASCQHSAYIRFDLGPTTSQR